MTGLLYSAPALPIAERIRAAAARYEARCGVAANAAHVNAAELAASVTVEGVRVRASRYVQRGDVLVGVEQEQTETGGQAHAN